MLLLLQKRSTRLLDSNKHNYRRIECENNEKDKKLRKETSNRGVNKTRELATFNK